MSQGPSFPTIPTFLSSKNETVWLGLILPQPNCGSGDQHGNISGILEAADTARTAFIPKYYSEHLKSINCFHVFFSPISVLSLLLSHLVF